jgi:hypothetical protein
MHCPATAIQPRRQTQISHKHRRRRRIIPNQTSEPRISNKEKKKKTQTHRTKCRALCNWLCTQGPRELQAGMQRRDGEKAQQQKERERKRESKRRRAAAQASKGIQPTEPGIDPGTLTLGHVIHDHWVSCNHGFFFWISCPYFTGGGTGRILWTQTKACFTLFLVRAEKNLGGGQLWAFLACCLASSY